MQLGRPQRLVGRPQRLPRGGGWRKKNKTNKILIRVVSMRTVGLKIVRTKDRLAGGWTNGWTDGRTDLRLEGQTDGLKDKNRT